MIRFINLTDQIIEGDREFAFYDTVFDMFCKFSQNQTWNTVEEFKDDYLSDINYKPENIQRYLNLIPKDWDEKPFERLR